MIIGILSDTHGDVYGTRRAAQLFESLGVEMVMHCGDVGSLEVISLLSHWPVHFVLGNVDRRASVWDEVNETDHVCHNRFGSLTLAGKSVALLHGDDATSLQSAIQSGQWDLICHGHTHLPSQRRDGNTLVLNPGAVTRTTQPSVATVELPSINAIHISLA